MSVDAAPDWFGPNAQLYAVLRPDYPAELFDFLLAHLPAPHDGEYAAWDVGTGSGQAAIALAERGIRVTATDRSADQLAQAKQHPKVVYLLGDASASQLAHGSVQLVTAAQAAHWFDLPAFYAEADRVLVPGGLLALWGYGLPQLPAPIRLLFDEFYYQFLQPWWTPERRHVEQHYRNFEFPYLHLAAPELWIERHWSLEAFCGYLQTWSAVERFYKTQGYDPVYGLYEELKPLWTETVETVRWPIFMRVGRKGV
jgi:SAM-dependent methyltransferase